MSPPPAPSFYNWPGNGNWVEYRYLPVLAPGGEAPLPVYAKHLPVGVRHTTILASYWLWRNRDGLPVPDDVWVFGDSGGFSVVAEGARISPRRSLRWLIRHTDAGVILDLPPYSFGGNSRFVGEAAEVWDERLAGTVVNVHKGLAVYEDARANGTSFRWWGVVQGQSWEQLCAWHAAVSAIYPFTDKGEGWALAPKPANDLLMIARFMAAANRIKTSRVHVLQTNRMDVVGTALALAAMSGVDVFSHDSATAPINAANRNIYLPHPDGLGGAFGGLHDAGWAKIIDHLLTRCACHACTEWRLAWIDAGEPEAFSFNAPWLTLHNHLALTAVGRAQAAVAAEDPERLLRHVLGNRVGAVLREWSGSHRAPVPRARRNVLDFLP